MTNANALSNSTSALNQLVTDEQCVNTNDGLDPLRKAIIRNINNELESDSIERARAWFAHTYPNVEIGEIPQDLGDFLAWLRPFNPDWLASWANASLSCINAELQDSARGPMIDWLYTELVREIDESSAIIGIADYLRPKNGQLKNWAESAFNRMMRIEDPNQKTIALSWLEERIAEKIGNEVAHQTIARWMHASQQQPRSSKEQRINDTIPCAPPVTDSNVQELKPVQVSEVQTTPAPANDETPKPKRQPKVAKETTNPLGDAERRVSELKRQKKALERTIADGADDAATEEMLAEVLAELTVAAAERDQIKANITKAKQTEKESRKGKSKKAA